MRRVIKHLLWAPLIREPNVTKKVFRAILLQRGLLRGIYLSGDRRYGGNRRDLALALRPGSDLGVWDQRCGAWREIASKITGVLLDLWL
jgi:hypothetical protein